MGHYCKINIIKEIYEEFSKIAIWFTLFFIHGINKIENYH